MKKHILVIDCGSTGIRSILINANGKVVDRHYKRLEVLHPTPEATENDPEHIWLMFKEVVLKAMHNPLIKIDSIAITNQRSTFTLWDKDSGKPLINFINWQDVRAAGTVRKMNTNPIWVSLRILSFFIGRLFCNPILTVTSMLKLSTDHTICKIRWILDNNKNIEQACKKNKVLFGTIDTWLLYKLTGNKEHITDYTNAAATTLLNPFTLKWNSLFCKIFKVPMNILPKVYNTNDLFANTDVNIFGKSIPVTALVGDQQASLFGHRCFNKGDLKISLGSGAFVSMNVGPKPKFSKKGLFPMVGWTFKEKPQYILEGQVATVGTFINWSIEKMKLFKSPQDFDLAAEECKSTDNLFCVPTLTGIRFPYFKPNLKASFSGITLNSTKSSFARAIIEGINHRLIDIIEGMEKDTNIKIHGIRVDGGVSNSNALIQSLADLSGKTIYRSSESDLASTGAAYFAGLATGMWKDKEEILNLHIPHLCFTPLKDDKYRLTQRENWKKHLKQIGKTQKR